MDSVNNDILSNRCGLPKQDFPNVSAKNFRRSSNSSGTDDASYEWPLLRMASEISSPILRTISFAIFIIIVVVTGVLTVYFTAQTKEGMLKFSYFLHILLIKKRLMY